MTLTQQGASGKLNDPVETTSGSGIYKVEPVDKSLHEMIQIIVKVTLSGGMEFTFGASNAENYKLYVGCSTETTMKDSPSLVTTISNNYSPGHDYAY